MEEPTIMVMKRARRLLIVAAFLALLLLPIYEAQGQDYVEYNVRINDDGSAAWRIVQVSDINAPVDSWTGFQQRILNLVDSAASTSHREMSLDFDSMQIDTVISGESKTTEYMFTWLNFSTIQNQLITFGDVFRVENFFGQLYGDAALKIAYPPNFQVKSVSPEPNERDNQTQTLVWFRTQDFVSGKTSIVLTSGNPAENGTGGEWLYLALGVVTVAVGVAIAGFYAVRRRKSNEKGATTASVTAASLVETDEDKIIKIIKSAGGTMRQSVITEQTRFSKAKTSQLLTALEQKGVVTRHKRGRDKIVTLNNKR
jgi:uncharacterized membrane protein